MFTGGDIQTSLSQYSIKYHWKKLHHAQGAVTRQNDNQHNDTQHNDTQHNNEKCDTRIIT
jgi:hypothetical protein